MTAEVERCNGVLEGCRAESEEVEVHAIPKPVLNEDNLKLIEDKMDIRCGGSENCVDGDETLPGSEHCEAELSNASLDVVDHAHQFLVEDHKLETREEGHRPECLLSENKEVDGESVENEGTDCQFMVSVDDHPVIELHDSVDKPKKKLEVPCLINGDDKVERDFVGNKLELPCLVNGEEKIERDLVGDKLESPCLVNGEERVERDLVEDKLESPSLVHGEERAEEDLVGDKLESPCSINREDGAERSFVGNKELEQRSQLVAEALEMDSPELGIGDDEKSEQCLSNGQNQASEDEFQCLVDDNCEFESQSISMEEQKLELSPSVVVSFKLEETQSVVSKENKLEQDGESQSQNLENEDDSCGHLIDEGKQPEPQFALNADKGPELKCVVEKSSELESHIVVTENDEIEMECLPNGDSEGAAQFDLNGDKELGSGCFDNENTGILTEDMDGQQVEEVHHGKGEISDLESSDCNVSNSGGFSDVLDRNSGFYSDTVHPDMQDEGKQPEPQFVLNADKGPALKCVVENSSELESHIVVTENDEIEMERLPNGDTEGAAQFDLNGDKELGSGCYDNENTGILTEDMDGQQVEEVHHGKGEISDLESSDCNVSNSGGFSDVLDKNSGFYSDTVHPDMQDEGKQPEPQFVLNGDKGPELKCVVEKFGELESHIVVTENDEIEMENLPNGDSEGTAQFDLNGDKEIGSGCFNNENNGILTENMDGQQVEEVHHGKGEISDLESSDCNVSNSGGVSDVLDKNSGVYSDTVHPDMQDGVAVSAADWVSTGVMVGSNGLFTPVSGNEQKHGADVPKKLFFCLVKIPRHLDNKIKSQIRLAQQQLDVKTQSRDFIRAAVQMKRASKEQMIERLRAARQERDAFRDAIRFKRQEMEPVQLTLNRMKNATSVEEFDDKISHMKYRIEHESIPLREEKMLVRDLKQLRFSRDQLIATTGPQAELDEAFNHYDKYQERSKLLGQELDSLKKQASQAEKNVQAVEKEFDALSSDLRQLQEQWNSADAVRQEAYEVLRALKKQEYERNIEFYQTRGDIQAARQYANSGQREALDKLCSNQVERIMGSWNKDVEFRKEYVKDNERSILKRLETLDGRSLGPDEEPPLPTNYSDDLDPSLLPQGEPSASSIRSTVEAQPMTMAIAQQSNQMELKANGQQSSSNEVAVPQKKAAGKSKKSQPQSSRLIPEIESFEVSPVPSKVEEEDLAKKEEEAAKMKERIRQEEMKKAKEAEERKRRQAERANSKALARAQREAERKEKEKLKKANKKAAAAAAAATDTAGNDTTFSSDKVESGASRDFKSSSVDAKETPETQKLSTSQRKKLVSQKVKPKVVFPAAKKGRKGLQSWIWVILAVFLCLAFIILWFYF